MSISINIEYSSKLADGLTNFVKLKRISGYDYKTGAGMLKAFDSFLIENIYNKKILTQNILDKYLKAIEHMTPRGFANYFGLIRQFSIWLAKRRPSSYVLDKIICKNREHSRPAYIFGYDQIKNLFKLCEKFTDRTEIIKGLYKTLFLLLYTAGIRINEALSLNINDYHPQEMLLHIRKGKFSKERYIILSKSMNKKLKEYLNKYYSQLSPDTINPVFIGLRKRRLIYNSVQVQFKKLIRTFISCEKEFEPTIHSLRHTFAVHRLLKWYDTEKDIYTKLPFLSTYMGHVKISSTQVYLHATKEFLEKGCRNFHNFYLKNIKSNI